MLQFIESQRADTERTQLSDWTTTLPSSQFLHPWLRSLDITLVSVQEHLGRVGLMRDVYLHHRASPRVSRGQFWHNFLPFVLSLEPSSPLADLDLLLAVIHCIIRLKPRDNREKFLRWLGRQHSARCYGKQPQTHRLRSLCFEKREKDIWEWLGHPEWSGIKPGNAICNWDSWMLLFFSPESMNSGRPVVS